MAPSAPAFHHLGSTGNVWESLFPGTGGQHDYYLYTSNVVSCTKRRTKRRTKKDKKKIDASVHFGPKAGSQVEGYLLPSSRLGSAWLP